MEKVIICNRKRRGKEKGQQITTTEILVVRDWVFLQSSRKKVSFSQMKSYNGNIIGLELKCIVVFNLEGVLSLKQVFILTHVQGIGL